MTTKQEAYDLPDDIAIGLAIGKYNRTGSVVRYATGSKKGQIVKHLVPIASKDSEQAQSLGAKALQFSQQHVKEIGIAVACTTIIGLGCLGYYKFKNREPKVLTEFRAVLKDYIEAIRQGTLSLKKIDSLIRALDALKKHKDYATLHIQLTAEDFGVLVCHIHDYTIKLATDNKVELPDEDMRSSKGVLDDLQSYLTTQKRIFEAVA